jgi:hypothetical protein
MNGLPQSSWKSINFYVVFSIITSFGIFLRFNQFTLQVLLDDEWHVIHQLLIKTPKDLFFTFGHADFSIPLALIYWSELKLIGLSEIGMRWPMMVSGISILLIFPLYIRKFFSDKAILIFSFMLAISPMLVSYSRTARPYALTLLFSFLALAAFHKYVEAEKPSLRIGLMYTICAVLSAWLHLISLPIVVAPFLVLGLPALLHRNWSRVRRVFLLGVFTLAGLLLILLPPILGNPEALLAKLGTHTPDLQTYYGVLYFWLGTTSLAVVLVGGILAIPGVGPLWRDLPLTRSLLMGLIMTFIIILVTQPAWVHYPLTFARYLLAAVPLLLLSISLGIARLSDAIVLNAGRYGKFASMATILSILLLMAYYSPLHRILATPNSNSVHSVFQFDYRDNKNLISLYQRDFPVSPFWRQLAIFPRDTLKIAVSPFSFESHHWDAARWEQISHQRVMPGFLVGFCAERRWGEVPKDQNYRFKNVGYLSDQNDLVKRGFDLVVYLKPFKVLTNQGEKELGMDTANCELELREHFPSSVYEDEWLIAFPLSNSVRNQITVIR